MQREEPGAHCPSVHAGCPIGSKAKTQWLRICRLDSFHTVSAAWNSVQQRARNDRSVSSVARPAPTIVDAVAILVCGLYEGDFARIRAMMTSTSVLGELHLAQTIRSDFMTVENSAGNPDRIALQPPFAA